MRLHILSDLHLEFAEFQLEDVHADVIVLAGDIHTGSKGVKWILKKLPNQPVIYVLGNHEFYGEKIPQLTEEIKRLVKGTNVHVLENDRVEIGDVAFLGATLWTDFRLDGNPAMAKAIAHAGMADYQLIRVAPFFRRLRPIDVCRFHAQSLDWLVKQIKEMQGRKTVVVTHHAPSSRSVPPQFHDDPLNPAFASNLEHLIAGIGVTLWIHGHIHHFSDYMLDSTRVIANPRGYPSELHTAFNPCLAVEL